MGLRLPHDAVQRPSAGLWRLEGLDSSRGLVFVVRRAETVAGYHEASDFVLRVAGVSRRHALLRWAPPDLTVVDLGSRNGTLVNGERIQQRVLQPGDEIRFGPVRLRAEILPPDELTLGLVADSVEPQPRSEETEWHLHPTAENGMTAARQVVALLLGEAAPAIADALRVATNHVGALGGALGEWDGRGDPNLFATHGDLGTNIEHPALFEFFGTVFAAGEDEPCFRSTVVHTEPPLACAGFRRPGGALLAMVLRGRCRLDDWRDTAEVLLRLTDRVLSQQERSPRQPSRTPALTVPLSFVRGTSAAMSTVYRQLEQLRRGDFALLVRGETGVGKEHLVRLVHDSSARAGGPFVAVNCSALPAELLEAEMFGIGRGVASGVQERSGRFQEADGGTLFLDEIGEMPLALQAKLLRALEYREVLPLGCPPVRVDVRVIAATNADLPARIQAGAFRADLYYRIAGYELLVPPLRERREDIPLLIQHFLGKLCVQLQRRVTGVTVGALRRLVAYGWPGNVRELENEMRRLIFVCPDGQPIDTAMLHPAILAQTGDGETPDEEATTLEAAVARLENRLIRSALERAGGSRSGAARLLGLSRNGLGAKMLRLGIGQVPTGDAAGD